MANTICNLFFCILLISPTILNAQNTVSRIERLNLGHFMGSLRIRLVSQAPLAWGRFAGKRYLPPLNIYNNPAFLSGINRPNLIFGAAPRTAVSLRKFRDVSSTVHAEIDQVTGNYAADGFAPGYPTLALDLGFGNSIPEGAILLPLKNFTLSLGYIRPFYLDYQLDVTGLESGLSTMVDVGGAQNQVLLNNYLDATNQLKWTSSSLMFQIAHRGAWSGAWGIAVSRNLYAFEFTGMWNVEGVMLYNKREYLFNDPQSLWPNQITQRFSGEFRASTWSARLGGFWLLRPGLLLDATVLYTFHAAFSGKSFWDLHQLPALNLQAIRNNEGIEEILDPLALDLSRLTYTESVQRDSTPHVSLEQPTVLRLGLLWYFPRGALYIMPELNLGNYKFRYGNDLFIFGHRWRISLVVSYRKLFLGAGGRWLRLLGYPHREFLKEDVKIFLPSFSLGYAHLLAPNLGGSVAADILPWPELNLTMNYTF